MVTRLAQHIKMVHNKEELAHKCQVCSIVNAIKNMKDIILPSFMNADSHPYFLSPRFPTFSHLAVHLR